MTLNRGTPTRLVFGADDRDAVAFHDLALVRGRNRIALAVSGDTPVPFALATRYRSPTPPLPPPSGSVPLALSTTLSRSRVALGEGAVLRARIENRGTVDLPMVVARLGIPGGMATQLGQLEELRRLGTVDFLETRPREVTVYLRGLAAAATVEIDIDLLAREPPRGRRARRISTIRPKPGRGRRR